MRKKILATCLVISAIMTGCGKKTAEYVEVSMPEEGTIMQQSTSTVKRSKASSFSFDYDGQLAAIPDHPELEFTNHGASLSYVGEGLIAWYSATDIPVGGETTDNDIYNWEMRTQYGLEVIETYEGTYEGVECYASLVKDEDYNTAAILANAGWPVYMEIAIADETRTYNLDKLLDEFLPWQAKSTSQEEEEGK